MLRILENVSSKLALYIAFTSIVSIFSYIIQPSRLMFIFVSTSILFTCLLVFISAFSFEWQIRSTQQKEKLVFVILLLPFLVYIPLNVVLIFMGYVNTPRLQDFGAYYNAAVRILNSAPLYQTTKEVPWLQAQISQDMPYLYPPIFIFLIIPFTLFPVMVAGYLWDIVILSFLIWSVSQLITTFNVKLEPKEKIVLYSGLLSFGPLITWVKAGQVSGLLAAFLCLAGVNLRTDRHRLSGVFTVFGGLIKPFYATSGAHLLRNRRRFSSAILSGLLLAILSLAIFGVDTHMNYIDVLIRGKGWGENMKSPNTWNAGHFNPFYGLGVLSYLIRTAIVLATVGFALYSNKIEIPVEYVFAIGVGIIPVAGPTTNTLALNAIIPAVIMVGFYEWETSNEFPKILLLSVVFIHIHPYTVEFFSTFGPNLYTPLKVLVPYTPVIQPAIYGMALMLGYFLHLSYQEI